MHDSNGKQINSDDSVVCGRFGLCTVTMMKYDGTYMLARNEKGDGFGYDQETFSREFPESFKVRSWKELCQAALDVQDASNLSGVVHSFSQVIREVRERLRAEGKEGTRGVNEHPVCVLYASKIASLTHCEMGLTFHEAYDFCDKEIA